MYTQQKSQKKRLTVSVFLLILLMGISMIACGGSTPGDTKEITPNDSSGQSGTSYTISIISWLKTSTQILTLLFLGYFLVLKAKRIVKIEV